MSSINPETVVSVLKDQIENYDQKTEVKEEGRIIQIADGIATVYGMDQAMYGELVIFETGVHGLVLNVERNCIGCVLLGSDHGLMEGSKVARTGVQADIPVGDAMIGTVSLMRSENQSMEKVRLKLTREDQSNMRQQELSTENLLTSHYRQVS